MSATVDNAGNQFAEKGKNESPQISEPLKKKGDKESKADPPIVKKEPDNTDKKPAPPDAKEAEAFFKMAKAAQDKAEAAERRATELLAKAEELEKKNDRDRRKLAEDMANAEKEIAEKRQELAALQKKEKAKTLTPEKQAIFDTLKAYVESDSWEKQLTYVFDSKNIEPILKERFKKEGFGAAKLNSIEEHDKKKGIFIVKVSTDFSDFFYVVRKASDGYKVDWPASVGYNPTSMKTLDAKFPENPVKVRVLAEIGTYFNYEYGNSRQTHYSIGLREARFPGVYHGFMSKNHPDAERIFNILKDGRQHRLTLEIDVLGPFGNKMEQGLGKEVFSIQKLVSDSWFFAEPEDKPEPNKDGQPEKKKDVEQPERPPDLMVIFQHSPRKSVAKLIKRGSPIPAGWEGGPGRFLSIQIAQKEMKLSAELADGKEGESASLTSLK